MNTQIRSFDADMALPGTWRDASPRAMPLPTLRALNRARDMALVSVLQLVQGLLQLATVGIGMTAGLALVLLTLAKDGVGGLIQMHTPEKQS